MSFIGKILQIKSIKVSLCFIEHLIKSINVSSWTYIEKKVYNPYDFWTDNIKYTKELYSNIIKKCDNFNFKLKDKNLLELWPGGFLWVWAFLKKEWIKNYFVIDDINHFEKLDNKTIDLYNNIDKTIIKWKSFDFNYIKQLSYNKKGLPLDNNSIDIIFSNAVYEHIDNPEESIKELSRITIKWWIWIHAIDYRDHIFNQKSLFFLTISDFIFNTLFKKSWARVNRKRHSDFINYFRKNSFEILEESNNKRYYTWEENKYKKITDVYNINDLLISDTTLIVRKI